MMILLYPEWVWEKVQRYPKHSNPISLDCEVILNTFNLLTEVTSEHIVLQ